MTATGRIRAVHISLGTVLVVLLIVLILLLIFRRI
jgi:Ni,Fe-hydrogenase I cytochrome b subunit